jgi:hypothetical protein
LGPFLSFLFCLFLLTFDEKKKEKEKKKMRMSNLQSASRREEENLEWLARSRAISGWLLLLPGIHCNNWLVIV